MQLTVFNPIHHQCDNRCTDNLTYTTMTHYQINHPVWAHQMSNLQPVHITISIYAIMIILQHHIAPNCYSAATNHTTVQPIIDSFSSCLVATIINWEVFMSAIHRIAWLIYPPLPWAHIAMSFTLPWASHRHELHIAMSFILPWASQVSNPFYIGSSLAKPWSLGQLS